MGRVRAHCGNWAAGLALIALLLQAFGPLARGVDTHYRNGLWTVLKAQGLDSAICKAPRVNAPANSQSMAAGETGAAALMTAEEKAALAKKLRCPCVFGSHACAYCVTYAFSIALFCVLTVGMVWLLARQPKDRPFPPRREISIQPAFRLSLSPRAPPFARA